MRFKRFINYILRTGGVILAFIIIVNAGIYFSSANYIHENLADLGVAQAALIPGAAIFSDGRLSPVFEDRTKGALELYRAGKVSKILVSGDNGHISYNEVDPVRDYLLKKGVPDSDIFLDHAGFDTYSTMYRARDIFMIDSIIICTQSFHLPRAVFIARTLGISASGFRTDGRPVLFKNYLREMLAHQKAFLDLVSGRKPRYLGDPIPITGDGRNYP